MTPFGLWTLAGAGHRRVWSWVRGDFEGSVWYAPEKCTRQYDGVTVPTAPSLTDVMALGRNSTTLVDGALMAGRSKGPKKADIPEPSKSVSQTSVSEAMAVGVGLEGASDRRYSTHSGSPPVGVNDLEDSLLMRRLTRGDREALDELIDRNRVWLKRHVARLLPNRPADQEDFIQLVWLRVWQKCDRFKDGKRFRPWLRRLTSRLYISKYLRRRKIEIITFTEADSTAPDSEFGILENRRDDISSLVPRGDRHALIDLAECITRLPPDLKIVIDFIVKEDLNRNQVAQLLHFPKDRVYLAYRRAIRQLRTCMEGKQLSAGKMQPTQDQRKPA